MSREQVGDTGRPSRSPTTERNQKANRPTFPAHDDTHAATSATPRLSVCMATYNGALFIVDQLESILGQITSDDEVIIYDDASTDDTVALVDAVADSRVRVIRGTVNQGHVRAFEKAITASRGSHIMLADQDDLWPQDRVQIMFDALDRRPVVAGNFTQFGAHTGPPPQTLKSSDTGAGARNLVGIIAGTRPYFGSAMGFRRAIIPVLLPIPRYVEAHDLWLAIVGNILGGVEHCDAIVLERRLHQRNLTPAIRRPARSIIISRIHMLRAVACAIWRSERRQVRTEGE